MRVEQYGAGRRVAGLFGDDPYRIDRAARRGAAHRRHDHRRSTQPARAVGLRAAVEAIGAQVRGDGVEAARVDDPSASRRRSLPDLVDGVANEWDLAGQVDVIGAGAGRCRHHGLAVAQVGPYGRNTTWVRDHPSSVDGLSESATMSGHCAARSPSRSRTAESLASERPANAMRVPSGADCAR